MSELARLQDAWAAALLEREARPDASERARVVRELARVTIEDVVRDTLPRTVAAVGEAVFCESLGAFLEARTMRSRLLRDVPGEWVAWVSPRWRRDGGVPRFAIDLAAHELVQVEVAWAEDDEGPTGAALALDRPAAFSRASRVIMHEFAVHRCHEASEPEAREVALLCYRDAGHDVRWLELSRVAAEIVSRAMTLGVTLRRAIVEGAAAAGTSVDDALLRETSELLADLAARGVLRGG